MDETQWGLVNIIGPAILGLLLLWLVLKTRTKRRDGRMTDTTDRTEQGAHNVYVEEEQRRRDGTDDL
jgi:hypothetical protein